MMVVETGILGNFYVRGILANLVTFAILLTCLFLPAGTLNYWQAWGFVLAFAASSQPFSQTTNSTPQPARLARNPRFPLRNISP